MYFNNAFVRSILVLLILGLIATAPAFAQSDNVCHADNPLHETYHHDTDCVSEDDWEVGWCRHMVYNEGWHIRLGYYEDGEAKSVGWNVPDEYLGSMCVEMFAPASYDLSAQPSWLRDTIKYVAERDQMPLSAYEIVEVRPDRLHNTRAAAWDDSGSRYTINRVLLRLVSPNQ